MKIALCLSGQMREALKTYEAWQKYLLDKFDIDIYIHTWNVQDKSTLKIPVESENADEYIKLYQPKKWLVEDYTHKKKLQIYHESGLDKFWNHVRNIELPRNIQREKYKCQICGHQTAGPDENSRICRACGGLHAHNYIAKLYSIYQVHNLLDGEYNYVIHTRPDLYLRETPKFDLLYLPLCLTCANKFSKPRWRLPDYYIGALPEIAQSYANIYKDFYEICLETLEKNYASAYSHTCLVTWYKKQNIQIKYLPRLYFILGRDFDKYRARMDRTGKSGKWRRWPWQKLK